MSSPATLEGGGPGTPVDGMDEPAAADSDIEQLPKSLMRVKILWSIEKVDQGHLVRLPAPMSIPVFALDDNEAIGVINLRSCIQAIVESSPELMAKAEMDYNVYAFDFSESDSPKVAQGLLSRLATQGSDRHSEMVTGRVCKNLLGIFSNGIRETLEVKLEFKPIPVATVPDARRPVETRSLKRSASIGNVEPLYNLLSQKTPIEEDCATPGAHTLVYSSRAASPALSQRSFGRGTDARQPQPSARMPQRASNEEAIMDEQDAEEEGPARKRARLTQADWHGRASFGASSESLRVAASTSASIRDIRPFNLSNAALISDQLPRAPTPRAMEKRPSLQRAALAASTLRRQSTSEDYSSPALSSECNTPLPDSGVFVEDSGVGGPSPISPDIPSSPPELNFRNGSPPPSSPALPELPPPQLPQNPDSGFQSETTEGFVVLERPKTPKLTKQQQGIRRRNARAPFINVQPGPADQLPQQQFWAPDFAVSQRRARCAVPSSPTRKRQQQTQITAPSVSLTASNTNMRRDSPVPGTIGQMTHIPKATIETYPPKLSLPNLVQPTTIDLAVTLPTVPQPASTRQTPSRPASPHPSIAPKPQHANQALLQLKAANDSHCDTALVPEQPKQSLASAPISLPPRTTTQGRREKSLPRAQSWTAGCSSDLDSDGGDGSKSRRKSLKSRGEGSGSQRRTTIELSLENAVLQGKMPKHCMNCGEIKPSTWRCYWIIEGIGDGKHIEVSSKTGIHWVEPIVRDKETDEVTRHRVYKQWSHLTPDEREGGMWEQVIFCNPCGDYIRKKQAARPPELWDPEKKSQEKNKKRARNDKPRQVRAKKAKTTDLTSGAAVPSSDCFMDASGDLAIFPGGSDPQHTYSTQMAPATERTDTAQPTVMDGETSVPAESPPEDGSVQPADGAVQNTTNDLPDMSHLANLDDFQLPDLHSATGAFLFPGTEGLDSAFGNGVPGSDFLAIPISQEEIDKMLSEFPGAETAELDLSIPEFNTDWDEILASTGMSPPKGWTPVKLVKTPRRTPGKTPQAAILFSPSRSRTSSRPSNTGRMSRDPKDKNNVAHIDLDTPTKPVNRLLFPSPRQPGEFKSLDNSPSHSPSSFGRRLMSALTSPPFEHQHDASPSLKRGFNAPSKLIEPKNHAETTRLDGGHGTPEDCEMGAVDLIQVHQDRHANDLSSPEGTLKTAIGHENTADKENQRPRVNDDLAYLFETPRKVWQAEES